MICSLQFFNKKKQKTLHAEGRLELQCRPMAYKGLSRAWLRNLTKARNDDDWTIKPRLKDEPDGVKAPVQQIGCPECGFIQEAAKNRPRAKVGFGQMTCQRCRHVTKTLRWTCNCNVEWHRCHMHVNENIMRTANLRDSSKRGRELSNMGTNKPLPKRV